MNTKICTYIYAYRNSSINSFIKPLAPYLQTRNITLGDIHYLLTMLNKDKSIHKSQLDKLLNELKDFKELILIKSIYPPKNELDIIESYCKKLNVKIITISKNGELLGVTSCE
ncbi:MAG: hypothetical protein ACK5HL_01480 [Bacilli bacterium]